MLNVNVKRGFRAVVLIALLLETSGGETFIFFSNASHINRLTPNSTTVTPVIFNLDNAVGLDVDIQQGHVYWSDVRAKAIKRANIDGTDIQDVITVNIGVCDGVAIEWRARTLYWTDRKFKFISVARLDGTRRHILVAHGLDQPRGIAVHPQAGFVFWTDWGRNPKIERARLDGKLRQAIITHSIRGPNGIAVDYSSNRIYWVDAIRDSLESADLDGRARRIIYRQNRLQPFDVSILGDVVYWSDWASQGIHRNNKRTGKLLPSSYNVGQRPMGVAVFDSSRQPPGNNSCAKKNGDCSYLCLPTSQGRQCACPTGRRLTSDGKSCIKASELFMLVSDPGTPAIYKVFIDVPNHNRAVLSVNQTTDLAYDPFSDRIYWIGGNQRKIHRAYLNMSLEEEFGMYTVRPENLAIDWLGRHLYWTDSGTKRIEAAQLDTGLQAPVVLTGLEKPRGLVLDPPKGHMYWTDWGSSPKIEKANMDGTSRWTLISKNLGWPNALALDTRGSRLFWADAQTNRIEVCDLYGENRAVVFEGRKMHPFGMAFFEDQLFWSDSKSRSVQKLSVPSGISKPFINHLSKPIGVYVYDPSVYKTVSTSLCDYAGCSHICFIRYGGYSCACPSGYRLGRNRKSCTRASQFLLFVDAIAVSLNILPLDDDTQPWTPVAVLPSEEEPADLDYDPVDDVIFWTDVSTGTVNSYNMHTRQSTILHRCNVEKPLGIGVEWIGRNVYWADAGRGRIEVSRLDGSSRRILIEQGLEEPSALLLYPEKGIMFFGDCGSSPKMEKAYLDGSSRITFVDRKITCPTSLNVHEETERIYWLDKNRDGIWSVYFNGANRGVTYFKKGVSPWSMSLNDLTAFVSDWKRGNIYKLSIKTNVELNITVAEQIKKPTAIRYYNLSRYSHGDSRCPGDNGGCSDLCLLRRRTHKCACPTGVSLSLDGKSCDYAEFEKKIKKRYLLISDMKYRDIFKIPLTVPGHPCISLYNNQWGRNPEQSPVAASIVFNPKDQLLYWTDDRLGAVIRANIDDTFREVVASEGILFPDGIDVDYMSGNVYWSDPARNRIEVANMNGNDRLTLTGWYPNKPGALVVDPVEGRMYWTDYGQNPKIETAHMDGSNRKTLLGIGLKKPIGLAIDFRFRRLYWADMGTGKIESMTLQGKNRIPVYDLKSLQDKMEPKPFGLAFSQGKLYWADVATKKVYELEVAVGTARVITTGLYNPVDVTVVDHKDVFDVTNKCSKMNGGCSNLCLPRLAPPGRRCACQEGVNIKKDDDTTCEGVYRCPMPRMLDHGKLSADCNNLPGSRCGFTCDKGYTLQGSASLYCMENGTWTGILPVCKVITCLPPIAPRYGYMDPPECNSLSGVSYGKWCYYKCNITAGFVKEGPDSTLCQADGMWTMDRVPPSCRDTNPPVIVCPENIVTRTDLGKPTARVAWSIPVPQDNADRKPRLLVSPADVHSPHDFPAGTTMVTYTAVDESGLTSSCSFSVKVIDKEAPKVSSCRSNYTFMTKQRKTRLKFLGIKFTDNVKVTHIDYVNGTELTWGKHHLVVRAHDKAGNTVDCTFDVMVYSQLCDIEPPINGYKSCKAWGDGGVYCSIGCNHGYGFTTDVLTYYMCSVINKWNQARWTVDGRARFPDCARVSKVKQVSIRGVLYYKSTTCVGDDHVTSVRKQFTKLLKKQVIPKLSCCQVSGSCTVGEVQPVCGDTKAKSRRRRRADKQGVRIRFMIRVFLKEEASRAVMNATHHTILAVLGRGMNVSKFHLMVGGDRMLTDASKGFKVLVEGICAKGQVYKDGKCVNCPVGHYYNASECCCAVCPADTYQDKEQQVSCNRCDEGLSTFGLEGARRKNQCRECKDMEMENLYGQCKIWRKNQDCTNDKPKMFKYCPKTCEICQTWEKRVEVVVGERKTEVNLKAVIPALVIPTLIVICIATTVIVLLRKKRKHKHREENGKSPDNHQRKKKKVRIQPPNNNKYRGATIQQLQVRLEKRRKKKKNKEKDKETKNYNGVACVPTTILKQSSTREEKKIDKEPENHKEVEEIYVRIPLQKLKGCLDEKKKKKEEIKPKNSDDEEERISTSLEMQVLNAQMDATQV